MDKDSSDPCIIKDKDRLFRRIALNIYKQLMNKYGGIYNETIPPNFFALRKDETGFSVEWEEYTTPEETRLRFGNPENYGVASLTAGNVRNIKDLNVVWTPDYENDNEAHSEIIGIPRKGELKTLIRLELSKISQIIIPVPEYN